MYESHFGFSGAPFQLNPDPAFYFDSRGHSNALAYLKFGAHQGEGFIVVTGEIGAGKTTLVRTLLEGLDPKKVVAAQVVSTQLESGELLQAILMAFGVASSNVSKAHLIASLEAFLTATAAKGKRALLIIDEAQNLKHEAVEELRMLSNFQLGNYGLLQSFLVGQPELRGLLQSKSMEQLRQRVIASCHLGPLAEIETRAYVEHRLRRVGWTGTSPEFAPAAFDRVHHWTGGVPRRINRLCGRLLLGAFLMGARVVSAQMVDETALELKGEIGEASPELTALPVAVPSPVTEPVVRQVQVNVALTAPPAPQPGTAPKAANDAVATASVAFGAAPADAISRSAATALDLQAEPQIAPALPAAPADIAHTAVLPAPLRRMHHSSTPHRPILCLVDSAVDYLKAGVLAGVFKGFPSLPRVVAVHFGAEADLDLDDVDELRMPLPAMGIHLGLSPEPFASQVSKLLPALDRLLTELQPRAVMVMGSSDADLGSCLLTRRRGIPLLRTVSGQRNTPQEIGAGSNPILIDKNADLLYTDSMETFYALYREGVHLDRVHSVGSLSREMLDMALAQGHGGLPAIGSLLSDDASLLRLPYGLIDIDARDHGPNDTAFGATIRRLVEIGRELPLLWPMHPAELHQFEASSWAVQLEASRVHPVRSGGFGQALALLRNSKCVVSGLTGRWTEASRILGVANLRLESDTPDASAGLAASAAHADAMARPGGLFGAQTWGEPAPEYWDAGTAGRIARQLVAWFSAPVRTTGSHRVEEPALAAAD